MKYGQRANRPPIHVRHSSLKRIGDSAYRSSCPCCRVGILLVRRDSDGQITPNDNCITCGQAFIYDDMHIAQETVQLGAGHSAVFLSRYGRPGRWNTEPQEANEPVDIGEGEEI